MKVRKERQLNAVADEVLALTAVVRPILKGVLYGLKQDVVAEVGGYEDVKLKMLPRLIRPSDGDVGVCFEYAVHEAMNAGDSRVIERIESAMKLCKVPAGDPRSILFGIEKSGAVQLIDTARAMLTEDARVLAGGVGQPPKLTKHLTTIAGAFRNRRTRLALPSSINGLWKADLFVGAPSSERWVAATVKSNPGDLEGAAGLRIGIVPVRSGRTDKVRKDDGKNLVICPLHHDGDFMQTFYEGWRIVQAFLKADAKEPKEVSLPRPEDREVARILAERREFPVVDVVEALEAFAQPELLVTDTDTVDQEMLKGTTSTDLLVAPLARAT
jgi:hypothetical protein